jgi:hypothetical protein
VVEGKGNLSFGFKFLWNHFKKVGDVFFTLKVRDLISKNQNDVKKLPNNKQINNKKINNKKINNKKINKL